MTLFDTKPDTLDGFDAFWALFPRDRRRTGKRAGKDKCKTLWRCRKLSSRKTQVMRALKEDIKDIAKGAYAMSEDTMKYFPGIHPWLNQGKYDRDIPEEKEPKEKLKERVIKTAHVAMTQEEFENLKPGFRKLARVKT